MKQLFLMLLIITSSFATRNHPFKADRTLLDVKCRDFFSNPVTRSHIDSETNKKVYRFGFYQVQSYSHTSPSSVTASIQIANMKPTYMHASPFIGNDDGILFTSNFIADLVNPSATWGLVKQNSDGTYDGGFADDASPVWYYQLIKGENSGNIYRVHWTYNKTTYENETDTTTWPSHKFGQTGQGYSTYGIPGTNSFFAKKFNFVGSSREHHVFFIDLTDPANPIRDSAELTIAPSDPFGSGEIINNGVIGANSLNRYKTSKSDILIGTTVKINDGTKSISYPAYLELDFSNTSNTARIHRVADPMSFDMSFDNYGTYYQTGNPNPFVPTANRSEYLTHVLINPMDNSWLVFSDEHCTQEGNGGAVKLINKASRYHRFDIVNGAQFATSLGADGWRKEEDEVVLNHSSFSHDGKWHYATWRKFRDPVPRKLVRINSDTTSIMETIFTISESERTTAKLGHEDQSIDNKYSVTDIRRLWKDSHDGVADRCSTEIVIIDNDNTVDYVSLAKFSIAESVEYYGSNNAIGAKPNFSHTGDFIAFQFEAENPLISGTNTLCMGVVATEKYSDGVYVLPHKAKVDVVKTPSSTIKALYVSTTEITQDEYCSIVGVPLSKFPFQGNNLPATDITWYDAIKYCNRKSEQAGLEKVYEEIVDFHMGHIRLTGKSDLSKNGYRLPTKAEWEYLYLGGVSETQYGGFYFEPHLADGYCWHNGNSMDEPFSVGLKKPNGYGLYDMAGNVSEWTNTLDNGDIVIMNGMVNNSLYEMTYNSTPWGPAEKSGKAIKRGFRVVRNAPIDMTPINMLLLD